MSRRDGFTLAAIELFQLTVSIPASIDSGVIKRMEQQTSDLNECGQRAKRTLFIQTAEGIKYLP